MCEKGIVLNDLIADQMLLNNALEHFWGGAVVPHSVRVNDDNRPLLADPQTVSFGAKNTARALGGGRVKLEFLKPFFKIVPSGDTFGFVAALGFGLICTYKNMSLNRF